MRKEFLRFLKGFCSLWRWLSFELILVVPDWRQFSLESLLGRGIWLWNLVETVEEPTDWIGDDAKRLQGVFGLNGGL